ncbi:MAG: ThuA domain-containing protein [Tannerella sp.]|jgi:type 1 glutamine amidotransferase|nr:ThuA domain-containing protein [Tannerella sp.]
MKHFLTTVLFTLFFAGSTGSADGSQIKALIVTGQNNHNWKVSNVAIKSILENSGLFTVDVVISPEQGKDMSGFKPDFAAYKLVILDYNGDAWSEATNAAFLDYIKKGGGLIIYHAADNTFREWKEFNKIIGFGGWGNRNESDGPYIYYKDNQVFYDSETPGPGGSHGSQHEFVLNCGDTKHPITKGLPAKWRHAQDELYDRMRGPGKIASPLYWAYSSSEKGGTGRNEIPYATINYGKARIFHTTLGHAGKSLDDNPSMQCTGFQVMLLRGAEWAATGKVKQKVPSDFPTEEKTSYRKNYKTD